jgi:hypothetical protein
MIQVIGMLFGLFLVYESWLYHVKKQIEKYDFLFWALVGSAVIVMNLFPDSLNYAIQSIGFLRALDFFTIIGFFVVTYVLLYLTVRVRGYEKKMNKLVEELALKNK